MPTLTIQLPGLPPVEHILREEAITLGRMKGNTIAIDDVSVSLSHAKIIRIGDDFLLKDLNSTNGTMLNGQSINEARLRHGDQLKFGEVLAVFRLDMSRPVNPAPAPVGPLTPTEMPPAVAHTVTGLIPSSQSSSAAKRPAPPPAQPAPQFPPQSPAAPPASPAPPPGSPPRSGPAAPRSASAAPKAASYAPTFRMDKKKMTVWLAPILGGLSALVVLGFVLWKSFSGGSETPTPKSSGSPEKATNPQPLPKPSSVATNKRTNAPAKPNNAPEKPSVTQKAAPPPVTAPSVPATASAQTNVAETLPENSSLADLVKVLRSPDVTLRRRAAQSISSFEGNAKDAVPSLRAAIKDPDPEVRMWSALALVGNEVYDKVTIPILVDALGRDSMTIRQTACIALALIPCEGPDKAMVVPALTKVAYKDPSEEVRRDALTALRVIAPETIKNE